MFRNLETRTKSNMIERNIVYNEDCLNTLKRMEDGTIDMVLTSPPYDSMAEWLMRLSLKQFCAGSNPVRITNFTKKT